jgi:hypothetical protein
MGRENPLHLAPRASGSVRYTSPGGVAGGWMGFGRPPNPRLFVLRPLAR